MDILNSRLYRFLDRFTNLFFLNVIWILLSLPLITLFPASAAMFGVFREWTLEKEGNLFKSYFKHFKANFKHSFLYGLIWFFCISILYIDLQIISELKSYNFILLSGLFLLIILVAFHTVYFVPVSIHFDLSFWGKIKHTFLFSIMFFPTTILCLLIGFGTILFVFFMPAFMILIFSPAAYLIFRLCFRTFRKAGKG